MQKERILVVDDEEDLCEILQFNLEQAGYSVDVANSAEEVIEKRLYNYDLFMLDIMMGEISGFKLAMHLKKTSSCANTPIIFLTAKDTETDKLRGFSVGQAQVAPWHGNFIINNGNATASDVRNLVEIIQEKVLKETGFMLECEIIFTDKV